MTRDEWFTATRQQLMTAIGDAHKTGHLSQRRLVAVAVACAETVGYLTTPRCRELLGQIKEWATEEFSSVDVAVVRAALWQEYSAAAGERVVCDAILSTITWEEVFSETVYSNSST